jgi:manganese/zinc/iron transport system permease protein
VITLAFETMGTVMVVSLLVAPGATAWLLSRNLTNYLTITLAVSLGAALTGRLTTLAIDASTTAATSCAALALFGTAFMLAPHEGWLARWRSSIKTRERLDARLILVHLWHHEVRGDAEIECLASALEHHLNMPVDRLTKALDRLVRDQLAEKNGPLWQTTKAGTLLGRSVVEDDTGNRED